MSSKVGVKFVKQIHTHSGDNGVRCTGQTHRCKSTTVCLLSPHCSQCRPVHETLVPKIVLYHPTCHRPHHRRRLPETNSAPSTIPISVSNIVQCRQRGFVCPSPPFSLSRCPSVVATRSMLHRQPSPLQRRSRHSATPARQLLLHMHLHEIDTEQAGVQYKLLLFFLTMEQSPTPA